MNGSSFEQTQMARTRNQIDEVKPAAGKKNKHFVRNHGRMKLHILTKNYHHKYHKVYSRNCVIQASMWVSLMLFLSTPFGVSALSQSWVRQRHTAMSIQKDFQDFVENAGGNYDRFQFRGNFLNSGEGNSRSLQNNHELSDNNMKTKFVRKYSEISSGVASEANEDHIYSDNNKSSFPIPNSFFVDIFDSSIPINTPYHSKSGTFRNSDGEIDINVSKNYDQVPQNIQLSTPFQPFSDNFLKNSQTPNLSPTDDQFQQNRFTSRKSGDLSLPSAWVFSKSSAFSHRNLETTNKLTERRGGHQSHVSSLGNSLRPKHIRKRPLYRRKPKRILGVRPGAVIVSHKELLNSVRRPPFAHRGKVTVKQGSSTDSRKHTSTPQHLRPPQGFLNAIQAVPGNIVPTRNIGNYP